MIDSNFKSYIVTRVQFAPNDRSLLATCGRDGILAICQVLPTPATIIYQLKGHTAAINGSLFSFIYQMNIDIKIIVIRYAMVINK